MNIIKPRHKMPLQWLATILLALVNYGYSINVTLVTY